MEYFVISAKFVPLKYYTLSSQLRRLTSFSVGLFGSANSVTRSYPVMRKSCIATEICTWAMHLLVVNVGVCTAAITLQYKVFMKETILHIKVVHPTIQSFHEGDNFAHQSGSPYNTRFSWRRQFCTSKWFTLQYKVFMKEKILHIKVVHPTIQSFHEGDNFTHQSGSPYNTNFSWRRQFCTSKRFTLQCKVFMKETILQIKVVHPTMQSFHEGETFTHQSGSPYNTKFSWRRQFYTSKWFTLQCKVFMKETILHIKVVHPTIQSFHEGDNFTHQSGSPYNTKFSWRRQFYTSKWFTLQYKVFMKKTVLHIKVVLVQSITDITFTLCFK